MSRTIRKRFPPDLISYLNYNTVFLHFRNIDLRLQNLKFTYLHVQFPHALPSICYKTN